MNKTDTKNFRYFKVQGTHIVRAKSQKDAILATQRARLANTAVLDSDFDVERIARSDVPSDNS